MFRYLLLWLVPSLAFAAGKDRVPAFTLVSAVSMGADITSSAVDARGWDNVDFELLASGSPVGSFFVDCTLTEPSPPASTSQTWVALGITPTPAVSGSASNLVIEINQTGCSYLRLRYVRTSGTGTLTAYVSEKQL